MGIVDLGSVLKLHNGEIVVVVGIVTGGLMGTFYTVIAGDTVKEINDAEIKEVINEH